MPVIFMKK